MSAREIIARAVATRFISAYADDQIWTEDLPLLLRRAELGRGGPQDNPFGIADAILSALREGGWAVVSQADLDCFVSEAVRAAMSWQPIETAPKDGTHILVFPALLAYPLVASWERPARTPPMMLARFGDTESHPGFWRVAMSAACVPYEPTHWMPLPAPPAAEEEQP